MFIYFQFNNRRSDHSIIFHFNHIQVWTNEAILEWGVYIVFQVYQGLHIHEKV